MDKTREEKEKRLYWMIESEGLTWRRRLYIRAVIYYEAYQDLVTVCGLASCSITLSLAVILNLGAWAWIPAGLALLVGLAGLCYPIRRAAFWLLSRLV